MLSGSEGRPFSSLETRDTRIPEEGQGLGCGLQATHCVHDMSSTHFLLGPHYRDSGAPPGELGSTLSSNKLKGIGHRARCLSANPDAITYLIFDIGPIT